MEFIQEEPSKNNRLGYLTTKKGLRWYENNQNLDEDTISIHTCYNTLSDGSIAKYTIEVKTVLYLKKNSFYIFWLCNMNRYFR